MLEGNGKLRNTVPYSAVLYNSQGVSWVFTAPEPLTFVRERIKIDFIDGDLVVLTDGPAPRNHGRDGGGVGALWRRAVRQVTARKLSERRQSEPCFAG